MCRQGCVTIFLHYIFWHYNKHLKLNNEANWRILNFIGITVLTSISELLFSFAEASFDVPITPKDRFFCFIASTVLLPRVYSSYRSLSVYRLFISMLLETAFKSTRELPFLFWDISCRYRRMLQPILVPWQLAPDNLSPSCFTLEIIQLVCHGRQHVYFTVLYLPTCFAILWGS